MKSSAVSPLIRVRRSKIHGTGVFAKKAIRKGTRITQYVGEHISHAEADRRYENKAHDDNHTFLFTLDSRTVIDGGSGGSSARYINHSCDPNCETVIDKKRVFVEAVRAIRAGEEICYDYMIERDKSDPPDIDVIFACRCGSKNCRGTMLLPPKKVRRKKKVAKKKAAKKKAAKKKAVPTKSKQKVLTKTALSQKTTKKTKKTGKRVSQKKAAKKKGAASTR
jgi:hypothetical protein